MAEHRLVDIEHRINLPDGSIRHVKELAEIIRDKDRNVVKVSGTVQDITERIQTKMALKKQKDHFEQFASASSIGLAHVVERKLIWANKAAEEMFGYTPEEYRNQDVRMLFPDEEEYERVGKIVYDKMQKNEEVYYDARYMKKDGTIFWVHERVNILDPKNPLADILLSLLDISDRKAAEEKKLQLESQILQAQKMESVGRLAGGVAHDINNMLSVIHGNAEMALEDMDPTQSLHDNLIEIQKAAQRSTNVVRQLLAFARKQTIAPKVLDLNEIVEEMLKMLRRLIGEDIDLSWQPSHDIWPVKMDPAQIDQVLANLSVNARDAIQGVGKLTIETGNTAFDEAYCALHPGSMPGEYVLLAVSDDGCGMDKETLDNIFEPFFTTKEAGKGTGLGLATVYGITKQNNGFINVYSEPDQGTTIKIYLPRHRAVDEPLRPERADGGEPHGSETILLVEDETTILKMTRMMLERLGYTVLAAATPGEAMDVARMHSEEIDLLMTDVVMPEMNGRDLAGKLLSLYPDLNWLFMSGYTEDAIAHHGILDEGVSFIQKPFSKQELSKNVRSNFSVYRIHPAKAFSERRLQGDALILKFKPIIRSRKSSIASHSLHIPLDKNCFHSISSTEIKEIAAKNRKCWITYGSFSRHCPF